MRRQQSYRLRTRYFSYSLRIIMKTLCGPDHVNDIGHVDRQKERPLPSFECPTREKEEPEQDRQHSHQQIIKEESLVAPWYRTDGSRDSHHEKDVEGDTSDDITDRKVRLAPFRGHDGGEKLRQTGTHRNDRQPDDTFRNA